MTCCVAYFVKWHGMIFAWHCTTWHDVDWHGMAWRGIACCVAWHYVALQGIALGLWRSVACAMHAWIDMTSHVAWHRMVRCRVDGYGTTRPCMVKQFWRGIVTWPDQTWDGITWQWMAWAGVACYCMDWCGLLYGEMQFSILIVKWHGVTIQEWKGSFNGNRNLTWHGVVWRVIIVDRKVLLNGYCGNCNIESYFKIL